jgi:anti-sigma-K factor RskA
MHCAGFNSDTYDRYVLGLLEEPDRSNLETQIQEHCPACLTGVQRSMNLWLVFAETLENAEPSEDFRGRIVRIAELSRKVLTFPKNSALRERSSVSIGTLVVICAVTCVLLVSTWFAARAWTRIDRPTSTPDIERLAQELASTQVKLDQEIERRKTAEAKIGKPGVAAVDNSKHYEDSLLKLQAEVEQYKQQVSGTSTLLNSFARSGARLIPMKATEAAGKGLGYAIFAQKTGLVFVGSNLPPPADGHTFQFWVLRGEEPAQVLAGFMPPENTGSTWILHYDDTSMLAGMTGVLVTEEPIQGTDEKPSGPKIFEASTVAEQD